MYNLEDTICAQSTPQGRGGLHVIRVSGDKSLNYVKSIFNGFPKQILANYVYYGKIKDPKQGRIIDEVLVTYFQEGRSFTAEDTVEISCHGNPLIVKEILNLLIAQGCRLADRGEFTYRAYKNGRIDLAQAESVLTLIEANSNAFIDKALRQLDGEFTQFLLSIEEHLVWAIARLEAMIDFSTEDIEIESKDNILDKVYKSIELLKPLVQNFEKRHIIDKGIKTLIFGPPNVGKSSLLNEFLGRKRAIVSEVAGTTRDFLSETTIIEGKAFEMVDTAGLRATANQIESEGIQMAQDQVSVSDLVLILLDYDNYKYLDSFLKMTTGKKALVLINKSELLSELQKIEISSYLDHFEPPYFFISVYEKTGLQDLSKAMSELFDVTEQESSLEVISVRQRKLLETVLSELLQGAETLKQNMSEEFVLSHLNLALKELLQLRFIEDEEIVRDKIFKDFCLGK